jgi:hypothetical protein
MLDGIIAEAPEARNLDSPAEPGLDKVVNRTFFLR